MHLSTLGCFIVAMLFTAATGAVEKPDVKTPIGVDQPVRIAVPYAAPDKGFVSLALYDQAGTLVRNLLCAQYVEKGARTATWDGTTDQGLPVSPGSYSAKAVFFTEPPSLSLLVKVGKAGNPPWRTPDGKGDWGGNLGHPTSICANQTAVVSAWVCVEDNQITGVQQMDVDGAVQMRYSTFYPWDCRWASVMDERNLYLGILRDSQELQIAEYTVGNPRGRILLSLPSKMSVETTGFGRSYQVLQGLALTPERIFASVANNHELFVIERASGKILDTVTVPGANGLAIHKDRLLVVSGQGVLRYTLDGKSDGAFLKQGVVKAPGALCVGSDMSVYVADSGDGGTKQIHVFDASGKHLRALGKLGGAANMGRYDGESGFGEGVSMCMGPGGKSLFINDIATGFPRTSRWSLSGTLEQQWFSAQLDNYAPPVNPARPNEVVRISGEFDPSNIQAWEIDPAKKTWRPSWRYTAPYAASWHEDVIRGYKSGQSKLKKEQGYPESWPFFPYGASGGLRTYKGRNYMMSTRGVIYTYGPDAPPKLVAMACTHRCERKGDVVETFGNSGPLNWFAWADRNGDGKPQIGEVNFTTTNPAPLGNAQWLRCTFDDQLNIILHRWTDPDYANAGATELCKLPLLEILPDGVPVYDWNKVESIKPALAKPTMDGGGPTKVHGAFLDSIVDGGDSWYALIEATGNHPKLGGIDGDGWWASRNWRKKICRFDKATGACRWAVGRRTSGVAQPGEMYNPMMLAGYAGNAVFAADAMGVVWVWNKDGLYLGRLYNGPEDKKADANSTTGEMMGASVITVGKTIRLMSNDCGTLVHEVLLPTCQPLIVKPVSVTADQATHAKPWDPDGGTPSQKPVYRVQSLALHKAAAPVSINGNLDRAEGWLGLGDGTKVDEALVWLDGVRVASMRALYDDQRLYLAYEVSSVNGPVNAGSELPICPFVSGAYVDASFAPDWSAPQRPEAREGDVRVLVAPITGKDAIEPFQRGYWQKKSGGTGGQTITSPAASLRMDQIAEIPGLQQAWKVVGPDSDGKRVKWQLEISIPLAAIGLANPKGRSIGFDTSIGIANPAGNGRERAAHWGGLSETAVVDRPGSSRLLPEYWGTLIFIER